MISPSFTEWVGQNIGFLIGTAVLTMLWLLAMHQVCVCPLNQMGTLFLRMSIALALTLEINILCLHLARRPSASDLLFWSLVYVLSFSVFRIVRSSQQHRARQWFVNLERLWLGVSFLYSLWIVLCLILWSLKQGMFDENMFYFAFYLYLIVGAAFVLLISCKICSTINDSVSQLHHHSSSQMDRERSDVDSTSHSLPRSDPMRTLLNLSKAKCLVGLTIVVSVAVVMVSSIAIFFRAHHAILSGPNIDTAPSVDIFHYLFVFTFYVSSIAVHWCSVSRPRLSTDSKPRSHSNGHIDTLWTALCKLWPARSDRFGLETATKSAAGYGAKSNENAADRVKAKGDAQRRVEREGKAQGRHSEQSSAESLEIPDLDSIVSNTLKSPSLAVAIGVNAPMSITTLPPNSMTKDNELSVLGVPLNKINSRGQMLGKRGAARPRRLVQEEAKFSLESGIGITSPSSIKLKDLPPASITAMADGDGDGVSALSPYQSLPRLDIDGGTSTVLEEVELMLNEIEESVTVVVFEFDDVLCTNSEAMRKRSDTECEAMPLLQKKLCFGGGDRIQSLKRFLRSLVRCERRTREDDVKCFVFSDQKSATVLQFLKDIKLLRYFLSAMPDGSGKLLSHIIGSDHMMQYQCEGKRHLIMFKLLKTMNKFHDEILYVGHDKDVVQHLEQIKCCKTYLCKTKGLVDKDFETIRSAYF